ncbi:MAG: PAS domain-containing protein, partial [Betaproteobacteria bacterium]|nr:PAS domain-containing protein [Betaproteobacteria bacterium]
HPGRDTLADYYLLAFVPVHEAISTAFDAESNKHDGFANILRDELEATRENLQTVIEELETSNEEMQALNEELQSTNEELQSTNEELETSNEELQSTNEELNTVNDEMQRTGREMAQVNADLLLVLESLSHPIMLLDQRLQLSRYNHAAEQMFRITLHRDGPGLNQLTLPQSLNDLGELLLQTLHNGQASQRQFSHESQHLVLSIDPCAVPSNSTAGVLVQVRDISSFINVQKELQTSKERLESILDNSIMYSVITNHAGRIEFVSKTMSDWLGQPKSKLLGSMLWPHFDTRTAKLLRQRHAGAMANDTATEMEEVIPLNRQSFRLHSIRVPLFDNEGNAVGVCWKALDISEKERVQQALADSEALSRAVLTAMPAIIAVLDTHGTIVSVNDAWQQFATESGHHDAAYWVGKNYLDYCEAEKKNQLEIGGGIRDVLAGRRPLFVHEYSRHSPTQQRWFRMLVAPLPSQAGGAAVMHVDISASVMAQQELQSINTSLENRIEIRTRDLKQAVDELEMFSFSVSHDLRSPLRTLIGYSELLSTDYADQLDNPAREHLGRIVAAARRMSQYLDELLKLSHLTRGELVTTQVDISAMAREIGEEETLKWPNRRVEFTVADGLVAKADPNLLRAVLENLIGNAWKYTQDRNPARIDVGQTRFENQPTFYIRDNGMGFDMSFRDKLFKPFQRLHTDTAIPGSGLGLAVSKRIIVRHGGNIFAEARPGFGATFYFTLPS